MNNINNFLYDKFLSKRYFTHIIMSSNADYLFSKLFNIKGRVIGWNGVEYNY